MKIYPKALLATLPLVLLSLVTSVGVTYFFSNSALTSLAEIWLETRLSEALQAAREREEMLHRYGLASLSASVLQAQFDAGSDMLTVKIGRNGFISAVTSNGSIAVHPDEALIGKDVSGEAWFRDMQRSSKGQLTYSLDGARLLARFSYFGPWQWYVLANSPESEIYGPVGEMKLYVVLLGSTGALVIALVLMVLTRRLTSPLQLLEAGAGRIAQGDLTARVSLSSHDELGSLANAFNTMANRLHGTLAALQHSEHHFRSLIENASDLITIMDRDGLIRYASPSTEKILGYRAEELEGRYAFDFVHPEDLAAIRKFFDGERRGSDILGFEEYRFRHKDGSWRVIESIGQDRLRDPSVGGIIVNSRDTTERRHAEEALKRSEERYRDLADLLPQPVIELGTEGELTFANRAAFESFAFEREDFDRGLSIVQLIATKDRDRIRQDIERIVSGIPKLETEYAARRKDGGDFPVSASLAPVFYAGKPSGLRGIFIDMTERKRMEGELLKTQKLESLGVLAGGIAHDFNNILTAVLGNVALAKMSLQTRDRVYNRLEETEKACLRARDLTRQLLTFSKGGAPVKKTVSLPELILDSAGFALRGSNVSCQYALSDDLWPVEGDEGQLSQVLSNLVLNAEDAMPDGGAITITARNVHLPKPLSSSTPPGRYVKITVEDRGEGIPKELQPRVFDPYFTTKLKGSGLGLTTVHSIVQKHDGHVSVESEPGVGSTFTIHLPASESHYRAKAEEKCPLRGGRERVLIMDDEEVVRDIASAILTELGYEVEVSEDGVEAIGLYKRFKDLGKPFDAVIMDLTIPGGMGGREAVRKILQIDPGAKVIVSSGYSNDPIMSDHQKYGFADVVVKPYRITDLSEALRRVIKCAP